MTTAAPPPNCETAPAWERTTVRRVVIEDAPLTPSRAPHRSMFAGAALAAFVAISSALHAPESFTLIAFAGLVLYVLNLMFRTPGVRPTTNKSVIAPPESWAESERAMQGAMRAPRFDGSTDPEGRRMRVRGRVRARTVIDAPDDSWCVAWERHGEDNDESGAYAVESAGGVFDVETDGGVTVRVDAREVALRDWRKPINDEWRVGDRFEVVAHDGAWVDIEGAMRVERSTREGYRGGMIARMEGTELAPVHLAILDEPTGAETGVRVAAAATTAEDDARDDEARAARGQTSRR